MHTAAKSDLVFTEVSSWRDLAGGTPADKRGRFYRRIISSPRESAYSSTSFSYLGNWLIALIEHAAGIRRMGVVEYLSRFLLNLPLGKEYKSAGLYYRALCVYRRGSFPEARTMFEHIAETAPRRYKTRALLSMSATFYQDQDYQSFFKLCLEALRSATTCKRVDPQLVIKAERNISLCRSVDGDHQGALVSLEKMLPLVYSVSRWKPHLLYEHLNSYAIELGEVGRFDEAENVCKVVLASPYAGIYPECRETANDIALKAYRPSRSIVIVSRKASKTENVVSMPVPESPAIPDSAPKQSGQPARVLDLTAWKKKMPKEPNGNEKEPQTTDDMTERERIYRIINLVTTPGLSEEKQLEILRLVEKIVARPDAIPDEDADKD